MESRSLPLSRGRVEHEADDMVGDTGIQRRELFSNPFLPHPYLYLQYVNISGNLYVVARKTIHDIYLPPLSL